MEFLEASRNPLPEGHESVVRWNGELLELDYIDERRVRMYFETAAARRKGPLMNHRRSMRHRGT